MLCQVEFVKVDQILLWAEPGPYKGQIGSGRVGWSWLKV